jgi:hypothetical protein
VENVLQFFPLVFLPMMLTPALLTSKTNVDIDARACMVAQI